VPIYMTLMPMNGSEII